jgi:hypothetical protein
VTVAELVEELKQAAVNYKKALQDIEEGKDNCRKQYHTSVDRLTSAARKYAEEVQKNI